MFKLCSTKCSSVPLLPLLKKLMKLTGSEFIRRFLLHALPSGFTKIRHYGILSSVNISTKLLRCMMLLNQKPYVPEVQKTAMRCPACGYAIETKPKEGKALVPL